MKLKEGLYIAKQKVGGRRVFVVVSDMGEQFPVRCAEFGTDWDLKVDEYEDWEFVRDMPKQDKK